MKGLELSRAYYEEYGKPMIDTQLAQYKTVSGGRSCRRKVRNAWDSMMNLHGSRFRTGILPVGTGGTLRRQVPRCSGHTIACRLLTRVIRGSHLHREDTVSEYFRWKDFIVNSQGFPTHRRTIWSGSGSRNAFGDGDQW